MEWVQVNERIAAGDDEHTEFKRLFDPETCARTVCAFSNTEGGVLILGVDDESRRIVGLSDAPEELSERLTTLLQSGLSGPAQARIRRHDDPLGLVFWVEVRPQRSFEPLRRGPRIFVRRGRSNVEPSPEELQELLNRFGYILTEEQTLQGTSVSDIDVGRFEAFMAQSGIDLQEEPTVTLVDDLRNRGVLARRDGAHEATLYGLMCFGYRPQSYAQTGYFWVECVGYAGTDRSDDVILSSAARGRLDDQVDRTLDWLKSLGRKERYEQVRRDDYTLLPEAALREVLVNAVCHRDYAIVGSKILVEVFDDRVVVTNPGTLPNHVTPAVVMAGGHPRARNGLMVNFMQTMRYMEGRGRGWPRIRRAMKAHNGLTPTLEEERGGRWVRVTLPIRQ